MRSLHWLHGQVGWAGGRLGGSASDLLGYFRELHMRSSDPEPIAAIFTGTFPLHLRTGEKCLVLTNCPWAGLKGPPGRIRPAGRSLPTTGLDIC